MAGKKQTRRQTRRTDAADAMPADDRRAAPEAGRPDDLPEIDSGTSPKIDGGNDQHPVHDEDQEDRMPSDYEREIDRIDAATRSDR